jgi:hypothetical protein
MLMSYSMSLNHPQNKKNTEGPLFEPRKVTISLTLIF